MTAILILLALLYLALALALVLGLCRSVARADAALRAADLVHEHGDAGIEPEPDSATTSALGTRIVRKIRPTIQSRYLCASSQLTRQG